MKEKSGANVLLLNRRLNPYGGVARCFDYIAEGMGNRQINLFFGCFEPAPQEARNALPHCYPKTIFFHNREIGGFDVVSALRRFIDDHAIQVIFACTLRSFLLAKLATNFSRRVVFWAHGPRSESVVTQPRLLKWALFKALLHRGWLLCNSRYSCDTFANSDRIRTRVLLNGVKCEPIIGKQIAREALGLPNGVIICYIAEYIYLKDHRTLLTAYRSLAKRDDNIYLILCGRLKSIEADLIQPLVPETEARKRILLLGPRRDIPLILSASDVYVHTAFKEGFGNAVAEAMMAGLPVIAANAGGLPEVIGESGILIPPRDPGCLEHAMQALIADPTMRHELGRQGRQRALESFSTKKFADEFFGYVQEILTDLKG